MLPFPMTLYPELLQRRVKPAHTSRSNRSAHTHLPQFRASFISSVPRLSRHSLPFTPTRSGPLATVFSLFCASRLVCLSFQSVPHSFALCRGRGPTMSNPSTPRSSTYSSPTHARFRSSIPLLPSPPYFLPQVLQKQHLQKTGGGMRRNVSQPDHHSAGPFITSLLPCFFASNCPCEP